MVPLAQESDSEGAALAAPPPSTRRAGSDFDAALGHLLRQRRQEIGLSMAEVARRCGVAPAHIHHWETAKHRVGAAMLVNLCRAMDAQPGAMLDAAAREA
jgi:AcrR family transcriptional regulator